jgi:gamma-glutamyltranspeptidase / glutathione hydrolase
MVSRQAEQVRNQEATGGAALQESRWIIDKTEVGSRDGMVVTKERLASLAGIEMLQAGGNAIDAAVAAAFVSGVVEPWMSGVGGGGFMLIHLAESRRTLVIDYAMRGPRAVTETLFELEEGYTKELFSWRKVKGDANIHGWRSICVPGAVAGLCHALDRYGRLPLDRVMAPAIRHAAEGFALTWHQMLYLSAYAGTIRLYPETAATFLSGGLPKVTAETGVTLIRQPDLARTLAAIASDGPAAFYAGPITWQIAAAMASHGGLLTEEDLAAYRIVEVDPAPAVRFGPWEVFSSPCPSGGPTLLQTLAILDGSGIERAAPGSAEALHLFAEAARLAWADRFAHLCDAAQMRFPWQQLLTPAYAAARRALIGRERALERALPGDPTAHRPEGGDGAPDGPGAPDGSTTALVTADRSGNLVAVTQTLCSAFGSRVTIPGTGILMNNGMNWFDPEPGKANSVGPGKKPLNNMAPLIACRDGRAALAVSSSGGRQIPNANLNIFLHHALLNLGAQAAVARPRVDMSEGHLRADSRFDPAVLAELRRLGHRVEEMTDSFRPRWFASPTCLAVSADGLLTGGSDPLHPAVAIAL